jgi:hypothetical protein
LKSLRIDEFGDIECDIKLIEDKVWNTMDVNFCNKCSTNMVEIGIINVTKSNKKRWLYQCPKCKKVEIIKEWFDDNQSTAA